MAVFAKALTVSTRERYQLVDLTRSIEEIVAESKIEKGLCLVHASHATAAIIANENESGLVNDVLRKVKEIFPPGAGYLHDRIDDNASSHIASALIGASRAFPVEDGRLVRGTWQNIFLLELDGPRAHRVVNVHIVGE
ncbi:secondary thiamine-phosphate synthase enzyme YjbQ [Candidatus Bathyarchaeota archaeon]|jgi:secondary thiamine-phosphate synthase enzyme|nr:secondary thiamine-phosphate synthase enzyme YjbQ [Candidatus Bathyarchaeota archaeon]